MADVELDNGALEQRVRKPRGAAADDEVPDFGAVEDFSAPEPEANGFGTTPEATDVETDIAAPAYKLYFVRVPRPPVNEEALKKLQAQFKEHVDKLKGMNAKMQVKRNELRELRGQMGVARGLKDGSQPEYEEKLERLRQLRTLKDNYIARMQSIREDLKGLDCKSEAELDAKIKEMENKISHEGVALREEKQIVQNIAKLQKQREQIRNYDGQKSSLTELESEAQKVKAVIKELDDEFQILRTEREQAQGIMTILTKVKAAEAELKEMEEEQAEAAKLKNDVVAELDKVRGDLNDSMGDYRDNRTFSLQVRDMVAAGQVEEARALCLAQADEYVSKLATDKAYRAEYHGLWAQQRKFPVSDLLPESSCAAKEAAASSSGRDAGKGGKAAAGTKGAKAPPPKPQGAEKARLLIESFMAQAQAETVSRSTRQFVDDEPSGDADDEDDLVPSQPAAPPAPVPVAGLPADMKIAKPVASKPVEVAKVELPVIADSGPFVPPPVMKAEAVAVAVDKEALRAEQMRKAAEAEARKQRLAEQKEKKKKEGEVRRKQEDERKKAEELARLQGHKFAPKEVEPEESAEERAAREAAKAAAKAAQLKPANMPVVKSQQTAAAKRVKGNEPLVKKVKKAIKENSMMLALSGIVLLLLIFILMSMRS